MDKHGQDKTEPKTRLSQFSPAELNPVRLNEEQDKNQTK